MTFNEFDSEEAKKFLLERERRENAENETVRKEALKRVVQILKEEFKDSSAEIYLVGSILRPFSFTSRSDVDIVVKDFKGDRFDLWSKLETQIGRNVEIIRFETCHFQEFVLKEGLRVH